MQSKEEEENPERLEESSVSEDMKAIEEEAEKSWDLLALCKQMMEEEGTNWEKSKERRELKKKEEEERMERRNKAAAKSREARENWERKMTQQRITETLKKLPKNKHILIEREEEKRRRILLKEAKEQLWKRWRQRKGREQKTARLPEKSEEKRLEMIERELRNHQQELEEERRQETEAENRKKRRDEKKKRWEMLRWIVSYIEENKPKWNIRREKQLKARMEQSEENGEREMREKNGADGGEKRVITPEEIKAKRLEKVLMKTASWKKWRRENEEKNSRSEDEEEDLEVIKTSEVKERKLREEEHIR